MHRLTPLVTTAVLWLAAAGKAVQVLREPMMPDRGFWLAVLEVELLLGLVVLLGHRRRWVWIFASLFFLGLAAVAGTMAFRGEPDCGCFGVMPMNPWITLAIDLLLAVMLWVFKPQADTGASEVESAGNPRGQRAWLATVAFLVLGCGIAVAIGVSRSPPGSLNADGTIGGAGRHVVLKPEQWVGRPFPLQPYLDDGGVLDEGAWELVLARPGCPHCITYLASWSPDTRHAAIVSLDRTGPNLDAAAQRIGVTVYPLDPSKRWYTDLPVTLRLEHGKVIDVIASGGYEEEQAASPNQSSRPIRSDSILAEAVWFNDAGRVELQYIPPGSAFTLAYRLTAPTDRPLRLLGIHSECKCTTITEAPERVGPGEQAVIAMRFVAADKPLAYDQGILIRTDHPDPALAERRLVVTARIGLPLSARPETVVLGPGEQPQSVTVTNDGPDPIRLIYAVGESRGVTARVPREAIAPGASVEVPIIVDHQVWDGQPTRLRIPTTDKDQPDLFIAVRP